MISRLRHKSPAVREQTLRIRSCLQRLAGFDLILHQKGTDGAVQARLLELDLEGSGGGKPYTAHRSLFPAVQAEIRDIRLQPHTITNLMHIV